MKILKWVLMGRNSLVPLFATALLLFAAGSLYAKDPVDIYQQNVPEMTTVECGRCHLQIFETLRDAGGLHKQECRDCHAKFHTFTPGVPWEERVPACSDCHDLPHGEEMNLCSGCHTNPHAPIDSLIVAEKLADFCDRCHQSVVQELTEVSSGHSEGACLECHQGTKHGQRPDCSSCHDDAHAEFVDNSGCVSCHPAHRPNQIGYDKHVANSLCGDCHGEQLKVLEATTKKHRSLNCVVCHAKEHGVIPDCQKCHGNGPHNPTMLEQFSSCGDCHGDAHKLQL